MPQPYPIYKEVKVPYKVYVHEKVPVHKPVPVEKIVKVPVEASRPNPQIPRNSKKPVGPRGSPLPGGSESTATLPGIQRSEGALRSERNRPLPSGETDQGASQGASPRHQTIPRGKDRQSPPQGTLNPNQSPAKPTQF